MTFEKLSEKLLEFIHKDEIKNNYVDKIINYRINNEKTSYCLFKQYENQLIKDEVEQFG